MNVHLMPMLDTLIWAPESVDLNLMNRCVLLSIDKSGSDVYKVRRWKARWCNSGIAVNFPISFRLTPSLFGRFG